MALQLFTDGVLAYDSRLEDYALLGLKTTGGLNKGGTAEIIMPPGHPAYNSFISYKTIVTLYEGDVLKFRGRPLYPADDFYNRRTIVCEGERCFLRDAVLRPRSWLTVGVSPAEFFAELVGLYNAEVDEFKRFTVGKCTINSQWNVLKSVENPTTFADFFDEIVEQYGGYITFTDAEDGTRAINWLAEVGTESDQPIEFGENLLEFARSGATEDFATVVYPYGNELTEGVVVRSWNGDLLTLETGTEAVMDSDTLAWLEGDTVATTTVLAGTTVWLEGGLTIKLTVGGAEGESEEITATVKEGTTVTPVGGTSVKLLSRVIVTVDQDPMAELLIGVVGDCIENAEAIALRGRIVAPLHIDTTDPNTLYHRGRTWLAEHSQVVTSLQLTAVDLSRMDKSIDSYDVGDWIRVISRPHNVDGLFQLVERTVDWLNPDGGNITLGKAVSSLTGADVSATNAAVKKAEEVKTTAKAAANETKKGAAADLKATEQRLSSRIDQLADSITLEVSGSLGGTAAIKLTVDGQGYEHELYLDKVRQAFADDDTAVDISAGLITFNAGTIVINSDKFKVDKNGVIEATSGTIGGWTLNSYKLFAGDGANIKTVVVEAPGPATTYVFAAGGKSHDDYGDCPFRVTKAGKLYATDAVIHGDVVTIDGVFKTQLDRGSLKLYYEDTLCGTVNTKYWSGASSEGISLRVEEGGQYLMFSHADDTQGSGYTVDYYLNAGWSDYEEKHIFQTSARFLDGIYVQGPARIRSLRLFGAGGEYLVSVDDDGLSVSKL